MKDFVAIDFETANFNRSSICAVGLVVVRGTEVVQSRSWIVRPTPFFFTRRHTEIHGLDESTVCGASEFPAVWGEVQPFIAGNTVAAYNAPFDMGALHSALDAHGLPHDDFSWACVLRLAREAWPYLGSYSLSTVTDSLGLELQHHDPLSDARACASVAVRALQVLSREDFPALEDGAARPRPSAESAMAEFECLIGDLTHDGVVTMEEFERLHAWLSNHYGVLSRWPYSEVADRITEVMADNVVTESELSSLHALLEAIKKRPGASPVADGIFTGVGVALEFAAKVFVFTGEMEALGRPRAEEVVRSLGGKLANNVTRQTDFVVVGLKGSSAWKGAGWGGKIESALALRKKGGKVHIVSEVDFLQAARTAVHV